MSLGFLLNREAKATVAELNKLDSLFRGEVYLETAFQQARSELKHQIMRHHATARRQIQMGRSADDVCLIALAQIAHNRLASGQVHSYRGRLSGIGQGWHRLWIKAMQLSLERGYCDPLALSERKEELRVAIAEVG